MFNFQDKKLVQGTSNTVLIEDPIEGSNGTALVFRLNDFIETVEESINKVLGGDSSYVNINSPTYTASAGIRIIGVGPRDGSVQITLPKADLVTPGKMYTIVDESGEASTKSISVVMPPNTGSNTILNINTDYSNITIYSNSNKWIQI